jgi:hypothetical protein
VKADDRLDSLCFIKFVFDFVPSCNVKMVVFSFFRRETMAGSDVTSSSSRSSSSGC